MPRPIALSTDALSKALSPVAQTASELATRLGVSRATVHRKLLQLADEKVVMKVGQGPRAGYRLPTAQEELDRARLDRVQPGLIRMEMPERVAGMLQNALEFTSRLGIGQFEQIEEMLRMGNFGGPAGAAFPYEELDRIRSLCAHLKVTLLGLHSNSSHGIHSPHVHPSVLQTWQVSKALRHRMAWDRQPRGGMGVWHDEPVVEGPPLGFEVYSQGQDGARRYLVELTADKARVLVRACLAFAQVHEGKVDFLVDWAREGELRTREGGVATEGALLDGAEQARSLAMHISLVLSPGLSQTGKTLAQVAEQLEQFLAEPSQAQVSTWPEGEFRIASAESSPFAVTIGDAPEGMLLNFHKGQYRVLGPSKIDGALVVLGQSHSIQTALAMARNHSDGAVTRSWAL